MNKYFLSALVIFLGMSASGSSYAKPCTHALEEGLAQFEFHTARMMQMRGALPRIKVAPSIKSLLRFSEINHTTVLLYLDFPDGLCAYRITPDQKISSSMLSRMDEILAKLTLMQQSMHLSDQAVNRAPIARGFSRSDGQGGNTNEPLPFAKTAAALADAVIPPAWQRSLEQSERTVVLPTGIIGIIPFAILPVGSKRVSLIDITQVSILPGLNPSYKELAAPYQNKVGTWGGEQGERSLIVGNPAYPQNDSKWIWPPLPGAEAEANLAAIYFPGVTKLIGESATVRDVKEKLEESDYLYFATHGMSNPSDPLDGGYLVFSDGHLTAREIQDYELRASLVVLSACQTGLGGSHEGGIIGLSRAFQIAGVPSVVMSLWSVDDAATALLMESFMRQLKTVPPDMALRQAMLETRKRYPQPDKWGAFTYFGWPIFNSIKAGQE